MGPFGVSLLTADFRNLLREEKENRRREEGPSWSRTRSRIGLGKRIGLKKGLAERAYRPIRIQYSHRLMEPGS